jgi:hypothetical protein
MTTTTHLPAIVDELGYLQAEISKLSARADAIKATLKASDLDTVNGNLFRATISEVTRDTLDQKAVRAKLSRQFIVANTKTSTSVRVCVKARIVEQLAA